MLCAFSTQFILTVKSVSMQANPKINKYFIQCNSKKNVLLKPPFKLSLYSMGDGNKNLKIFIYLMIWLVMFEN